MVPTSDVFSEGSPQLVNLVRSHWALEGRMRRLPGENLNILIEPVAHEPVILKIVPEQGSVVGLEELVVDQLRQRGHAVPMSCPTLDHQTAVPFKLESSAPMMARLQTFLPGQPWRSLPTSAPLLYDIGRTLARVHQDLDNLDHPEAHRTHRWDLSQAHRYRGTQTSSPNQQRLLEQVFQLAAAVVDPLLPSCPRGLLHGDANDENILVAADSVVGLLDFGDCLMGAQIQDLGITLAYALQQADIDLKRAHPLINGYQSVRLLTEIESELLFPLALLRLATSASIAQSRRLETDSHETWFAHEESTWQALEDLVGVPPRRARRLLLNEDPPGDGVQELLQKRRRRLGPSLSLSYEEPLHITRGRGSYLFESNGRPYLDLVNNVCHVGHCHPRVVKAIADQAAELNTNTRYLHESIVDYADRLVALLPDALEVCYFVNSGSEANELALRLARAATASEDLLVIDGAYHGHTSQGIGLSPYKFNGPGGEGKPPWVHVVPMPDVYRGECRDAGAGLAYALEVGRVIGEACARGRSIAGFFAESLLSCGGQIPLPEGYLAAAFDHVRRAGGVCIADEVQVGFGRVGETFWGFELAGVVPDMVVLGKPMGNGHPLGAVITTRAIAEAFNNGMEFFSTFGGNPVSAACGRAVLDVIELEGLQANAREQGMQFLEGLQRLQERHSLLGDVRGRGLFLGIELVRNRETLEPATREANRLVNIMRQQGVLLSTDGPLRNVIKIKPPLVIDEAAVAMTLRLLDLGLDSL